MKNQLDLFRGRNIAGTLIAATLLLPVATRQAGASVQDTPVSLTSSSWNADVVYAGDSSFDTATEFGTGYAWDAMWATLSGSETAYPGLPVNPFTSAAYNSGTPTNTLFAFQWFLDNNNCDYSSGTDSTLTLTSPTAYESLALLAASANATNGIATVSMVLHFADGTSTDSINYSIYDWSKYVGPSSQMALPNSVDRSSASSSPTASYQSILNTGSAGDFQMYETDFNLAGLGYSNKAITSISFSAPSSGDVGIFALSGYANPTQPPPVQPAAPNSAVPLPASLPLTFSGGTLLALAAIGRRIRRWL